MAIKPESGVYKDEKRGTYFYIVWARGEDGKRRQERRRDRQRASNDTDHGCLHGMAAADLALRRRSRPA